MAVELTAEYLRSIMDYDPETGVFTWKYRTDQRPQWNARFAGKVAGAINPISGYRQLKIDRRTIYAHRLAWFYIHGEWPETHVNHENGARTDNSLSNLRLADPGQTQANARRRTDNTTGYKGVSRCAQTGLCRAQIQANNQQISLGRFDTPEEAHAIYRKAAKKHFGEFACAG